MFHNYMSCVKVCSVPFDRGEDPDKGLNGW